MDIEGVKFTEEVRKQIVAKLDEMKNNDEFICLVANLIEQNKRFVRYMFEDYRRDLKEDPNRVISEFQYMADIGHGVANCLESPYNKISSKYYVINSL